MISALDDPSYEPAQVRRCQQGDPAALTQLRESHHASLFNILRARGATADEAEELLADLWGDCVPKHNDQPALLDKFSGKCSVQAWLATVATRRWIDLKRKQARHGETSLSSQNEAIDPLEKLPSTVAAIPEDTLVELLRDSLRAAFAACPPADLLMLRLVYLHGLTQRELMRMWGWSESKVSRQLAHAMERIEHATLENLKQKDSWLELTWQDFVDLCETHRVGFL
ncbi:MAG TPA: RNA polymerase sigma factor [Verrucomicrobiae bacterium]|nr:RNA polymerase sigma factor [Verrucomicrobiae bacterium]